MESCRYHKIESDRKILFMEKVVRLAKGAGQDFPRSCIKSSYNRNQAHKRHYCPDNFRTKTHLSYPDLHFCTKATRGDPRCQPTLFSLGIKLTAIYVDKLSQPTFSERFWNDFKKLFLCWAVIGFFHKIRDQFVICPLTSIDTADHSLFNYRYYQFYK